MRSASGAPLLTPAEGGFGPPASPQPLAPAAGGGDRYRARPPPGNSTTPQFSRRSLSQSRLAAGGSLPAPLPVRKRRWEGGSEREKVSVCARGTGGPRSRLPASERPVCPVAPVRLRACGGWGPRAARPAGAGGWRDARSVPAPGLEPALHPPHACPRRCAMQCGEWLGLAEERTVEF